MVSYGYLPASDVAYGGAGSGDGDAVEVDGSITVRARMHTRFVYASDFFSFPPQAPGETWKCLPNIAF